MKVSELLAELEGHRPNAPVVVSEIDALPENLFLVDSILKGEDKAPFLMARINPLDDGRTAETSMGRASVVL